MSSVTSLNSIFLGEVASVQTYGAFVKIPGSKHQGLVHRSQISKVNVPDVSEVLAKGDSVWCKVINTTDDGKIGLSMKVVDQGSGKDLDPTGVQAKQDEQRRKEWAPGAKRKAISLDAVFNTTCSKCGTRGHLGKDCFQVAGDKAYDLIPEDDLNTNPVAKAVEVLENSNEKKDKKKEKKEAKRQKKEAKKRKKAAKKLKKKLKKEAKREAKKAKKEKSKKKRKHSSSNSSSDSDSDSSSSSSSSSDSQNDIRKDAVSQKKQKQRNRCSYQSQSRWSRSRSRSRSPVQKESSGRDSYYPRGRSRISSSSEDRRRR